MNKKLYIKVGLILLTIIIIYKVADIYGTRKVDDFLKSKNIAYKDVSVNFLLGNIFLKDVSYQKDSLHLRQ